MNKRIVQLIGIFFILWGVGNFLNFFNKQKSIGISVFSFWIADFNITGCVFAIVLISVGWGIVNLNSMGRIWGLLILWWNTIIYSILSLLSIRYIIKYPNKDINVYKFFDESRNYYASIDAGVVTLTLLVIILFLGIQIFFLSQHHTKRLFKPGVEEFS